MHRTTTQALIPRRAAIMRCCVQLVDVPLSRANLVICPRSHHLNMEHWSMLGADAPDYPRIVGHREEELPAPRRPPVKVEARAGQVTVLTTAATHSASINADLEGRRPRVVLNPSFGAANKCDRCGRQRSPSVSAPSIPSL